MNRRALRQGLPMLIVIVLSACWSEGAGGGTAAATDRGAATVTLDGFSGLPNPTWVLDADQAADLLAQWDDLAVGTPIDYPATLGYRAMIVDFADGSRIWATRGFAVQEAATGTQARHDPGRSLELWLLGTGSGTVDPALLESIRVEITG